MDLEQEIGDVPNAQHRLTPQRHGIVVVDTCRLFREGLIGILHASCFDVLTAASNITDALDDANRRHDASTNQCASVKLLICSVDPQRGIELQLAAIRAVQQRGLNMKTVLLMQSCSAEDLVAAVLCGVDGIILKDISGEKLIATLDLIMHGQHVLPLGVALQVFTEFRPAVADAERQDAHGQGPGEPIQAIPGEAAGGAIQRNAPAAGAETTMGASVCEPADAAGARLPSKTSRGLGLSERETQILHCLVEGHANKLIARQLDIAEATVKVHIKGLLRKINVSNRTQAAIWALNQSFMARQAHGDAVPAGAADEAEQDLSGLSDRLRLPEVGMVFAPAINGRGTFTHPGPG